jgi:hypothetical protein
MTRIVKIVLALVVLLQAGWAAGKVYPYRWIFVTRNLRSDGEVEQIRALLRTAAAHGINGMVLSAGLDRLERQPPDYIERVRKVKAICDQLHVELIPQIFSAGYGSGVLAFDRNLAEGLPVTGAAFVVRNGEARIDPDAAVRIVNGGLEDYRDNRVHGFPLAEQPGVISFVDTKVFHGGKASLRFESFTANESGHARLMQEVTVKPHRLYRFTCWVKTEGLTPARAFRIQVLAKEGGRTIAPVDLDVASTTDWRQVTLGFNSLGAESVRIYTGVWGAKSGKFWLDDLRMEEIGPTNVLRRPGTPFTVRSESSGAAYEESRDFAEVRDPELNFHFDHDAPPIRVTPGSRIREGERLLVDYYHGQGVNRGQVTVCMSEPKLYQIWGEQARRLHELLAPKKYLLSMDEIRAGGSDVACKQRHLTMGEILGDCFTRQFQMLRALEPEAEVWTWSDMLDPNHNAHGNYYLVDGDYTGSWQHVPGELRIMCWYYERREKSLAFFSGLGFTTAAGAYYDGTTLDNPKGWLETLDRTRGAVGIMYTTWQNRYDLMAPFGDLVSTADRPERPSAPGR